MTKRKVNTLKQNIKDKRRASTFANMNTEVVYMVTEKHERVLKIGYASDLAKRMGAYRTHSTSFLLIDAIPGTGKDEADFQKRLLDMGFTRYYDDDSSEWFVLPDDMPKAEVYKGFKMFEKTA